jgi:hypothetical protein
VEPDYDVWKEYAYKIGVHPAVLTYLDIKKADFYRIETTVDGKSFVTARGWSDLSEMMRVYEQNGITVDSKLVGQYLQNKKIAKEFAIYYDLFNKYRSDYQVDKILAGKVSPEIKGRAEAAKFDERLALLGLVLDAIFEEMKAVSIAEQTQMELMGSLKNIRIDLMRPKADAAVCAEAQIEILKKKRQTKKLALAMSGEEEYACRGAIDSLGEIASLLKEKAPADGTEAFKLIKAEFDKRTKLLKKSASEVGKKLSNAFKFCEDVFGDGQEMLILVTELTLSIYSARFISRYGSKEYFNHNKELLFYERQKEIIREIGELSLD